MHGELARMIEPGLCSATVVAERCRRDAKLVGEVSQQRFRYFFANAQAEARMTKQAELDCNAETIAAAAPMGCQVEISGRQGVVPNNLSFAFRHAKDPPTLVVSEQLPSCHASLPSEAKGKSLYPARIPRRDRPAGLSQ